MKLPFLSLLLVLVAAVALAAADQAAAGRNPVIWADVPDPSVIRVDDTYYMSSTTMHMSPGLPIMKSKDLVNWELVSYAYDTLADNDALNLQNGQNAYGAGSWASSLRYHDGVYYVSTFSSTTGRTHVYRTDDIESGRWEANSFEPSLHDHSLFFEDDGRVFMVYGGGDIRLVELKPDLSGIKPGGLDQVIIPDASLVAGQNVGLPAEGSHLRKIDGKYYIVNIVWPKGGMRTAIVHRSDRLIGPYEGRVVLQDRGIAQGCLIDTPDGEWYAFLFRDRGAVGRIPYVVPVKWEDGWPVLGINGEVPAELNIPVENIGAAGIVSSDEFDDSTLAMVWQWNHNPDDRFWSLSERSGHLRLTTGRIDTDVLQSRNTLTQRTFGPTCSATVALDVASMNSGDVGGLIALQKKYGYVGVEATDEGRSIVMTSGGTSSPRVVQRVPLQQEVVHLRIDCDFRELADVATFYYSLDGQRWSRIGESLEMKYTLPHFMGYRFGLFNFATESAGGFVDFDYFRLDDQINLER